MSPADLQILLMYVVGWVAVTYLIYRYSRYSPWRSTRAGQSVMLVKTALWAVLTFGLCSRFLADEENLKGILRVLLVGYVDIALIVQAVTIVRYQGGWRRRRETTDTNAQIGSGPGDS